MWIHISERDNLRRFVKSKEEENVEAGDISIKVPRQSYGETEVKRKSIAPTLWQCCLAKPTEGEFYVYEVNVENPVVADDSVKDLEFTNEHWITKEVIGNPTCNLIGLVEISQQDLIKLKIAAKKQTLPKENDIEEGLWTKRNDKFVLRPGLLRR